MPCLMELAVGWFDAIGDGRSVCGVVHRMDRVAGGCTKPWAQEHMSGMSGNSISTAFAARAPSPVPPSRTELSMRPPWNFCPTTKRPVQHQLMNGQTNQIQSQRGGRRTNNNRYPRKSHRNHCYRTVPRVVWRKVFTQTFSFT